MKQLILLFLGVALFITVVGIYSKNSLPQNTSTKASVPTEEITVGNAEVTVEIADSEAERKKGLGGRENLAEGRGMLFVFPGKTSNVVFWMKEMKFPLDIVWINDDKIVKIDKNVQPEPNTPDDKLKRYYPKTSINFVLEVNAGFSDKNGVKVGDEVVISKQ